MQFETDAGGGVAGELGPKGRGVAGVEASYWRQERRGRDTARPALEK